MMLLVLYFSKRLLNAVPKIKRTGGISSFSGPALRSGLAVKFENTPPFSIPPPYTRLFVPDPVDAADGLIGSNEGVLAGVS